MNKKNSKFLLVLLGCLPLLMANSPAPYAAPKKYEDFNVVFSDLIRSDDSYNYYNLTLTNTGDGYIDLNDCYFSNNISFSEDDFYYNYELVAPGKSKTLEIRCSDCTPLTESFYVNGYTEFTSDIYTISDVKKFEKSFSGYEDDNQILHYLYRYETSFVLTNHDENNEYESCIYCVNYNGEDHFYYSYSIYDTFEFGCLENLDVNAISLKAEKTLFLKRNSYYSRRSYITIAAIIGSALFLGYAGGIITLIVFLITKIVKNCKNKKNKV